MKNIAQLNQLYNLIDNNTSYDYIFFLLISEKNIDLANIILSSCNKNIVNETLSFFMCKQNNDIIILLINNFMDYIDITYNNYIYLKTLFSTITNSSGYIEYFFNIFHSYISDNLDKIIIETALNKYAIEFLIKNFDLDVTQYYDCVSHDYETIKYLIELTNGDFANNVSINIFYKTIYNKYDYDKQIKLYKILINTQPLLLDKIDFAVMTSENYNYFNKLSDFFSKYILDLDHRINFNDMLCKYVRLSYPNKNIFTKIIQKIPNDVIDINNLFEYVVECKIYDYVRFILELYPEIFFDVCNNNFFQFMMGLYEKFIIILIKNHKHVFDDNFVKQFIEYLKMSDKNELCNYIERKLNISCID